MGLCGQVHDGIRLVLTEHAVQFGTVAYIDLLESVTRAVAYHLKRVKIAGVG
ncbi:hypothetical protein D3C84_1290600 [compost metagenome]